MKILTLKIYENSFLAVEYFDTSFITVYLKWINDSDRFSSFSSYMNIDENLEWHQNVKRCESMSLLTKHDLSINFY